MCELSFVWGRCLDKYPPDAMLRIVFWQRKVRLSSNLGQFKFACASLYDVPGRIIRKALFWTISIFFDRYFGRLLCQITQQYSRTVRTIAY